MNQIHGDKIRSYWQQIKYSYTIGKFVARTYGQQTLEKVDNDHDIALSKLWQSMPACYRKSSLLERLAARSGISDGLLKILLFDKQAEKA